MLFYDIVFNRKVHFSFIDGLRKECKLPCVLSPQEVRAIIDSLTNLKHRTVITPIYSAGLRLGEVLNLKITDIDSQRMKVKIRRGKGNKDREVMLSEKALEELRRYWRRYKPEVYLFEGVNNAQYSPTNVQRGFKKALAKASIVKSSLIH